MNAPLPPDDDFLDDDSDLRALYGKLPAAEPPAALDARIRSQAHAAAQGDQRVRNKTRRIHPGWAIAASVLLASGLILMTDLPQQADQAGQAAAPGINAELAQPPQLQEMVPAPAPAPPAALQRGGQPQGQAELRMRRSEAPPPPPAPETVPRPDPKPGAGITPDAVAPSFRPLTPPSLAPAPYGSYAPPRQAAPAQAAESVRPDAPAVPAEPTRPAAPSRPAPARQAESAASQADAATMRGSSAAGAMQAPDDARARAMQKAQAENAQRAEAVQDERKTTRSLAPRKVAATAEQQVERVRAMLKAGKHEEAVQALQALRQAWPEYEIPRDLRGLLPNDGAPR